MKMLKNKTIQDSIVVFALGLALSIYSVYMYYNAKVHYEWKMSPYLFPLIVGIFTLALSVSLFADGRRELKAAEGAAEEKKSAPSKLINGLVVIVCAVIYYALMTYLPSFTLFGTVKCGRFIVATILFLAALLIYFKERKWWLIALISVISPVIIYVLFGLLLNVRLP